MELLVDERWEVTKVILEILRFSRKGGLLGEIGKGVRVLLAVNNIPNAQVGLVGRRCCLTKSRVKIWSSRACQNGCKKNHQVPKCKNRKYTTSQFAPCRDRQQYPKKYSRENIKVLQPTQGNILSI
uniref:Uncharacterized protein n=1 Tax=Candidozyma auris TaxID=498019 RepID=A0A0L0P3G8_CANAR